MSTSVSVCLRKLHRGKCIFVRASDWGPRSGRHLERGDACLGCTGELPDKAAQAASLWATFVTKSSKSGWDGGEVMGVEVGGGEGGDL